MGKRVRNLAALLVSLGLVVSLVLMVPQSAGAEKGDVGIGFRESEIPTPKPPYDDTPTVAKGKAVNKSVSLPQTGEVVIHVTVLLTGIVLLVLVFAYMLEKQIKQSNE